MYEQTLNQAGLTTDQALIYVVLLKNGTLPAGKLAKKTPLKRSLVYKILDELIGLGLVEKQAIEGKAALFVAAHPLKIRELAHRREQESKDAQLALQGVLPSIISDYNLALGRPGIEFYEGQEGARRIAEDSLTSKTDIYSYIDNEALNAVYPEVNEIYVKQRLQGKIKKKMIAIDSPYIRERAAKLNPADSEIRVIPVSKAFATVMQIYDTKVSYLTLTPDRLIGIIIDDRAISEMHRMLFEQLWRTAKTVTIIPKNTTPPAQDPSARALPQT